MKEGLPDPLYDDLGRGYVGSTGYYIFTDRGGDRIERVALGVGGYLLEENGAYDLVRGSYDLREFVRERDPSAHRSEHVGGHRCSGRPLTLVVPGARGDPRRTVRVPPCFGREADLRFPLAASGIGDRRLRRGRRDFEEDRRASLLQRSDHPGPHYARGRRLVDDGPAARAGPWAPRSTCRPSTSRGRTASRPPPATASSKGAT